jgi:hypothetical protein
MIPCMVHTSERFWHYLQILDWPETFCSRQNSLAYSKQQHWWSKKKFLTKTPTLQYRKKAFRYSRKKGFASVTFYLSQHFNQYSLFVSLFSSVFNFLSFLSWWHQIFPIPDFGQDFFFISDCSPLSLFLSISPSGFLF